MSPNNVSNDQIGPLPPSSDLVWVHDAAMSWDDPAQKANPYAAVAFVFDEPALRAEPWAYHRLAFVLDGLEDLHAHRPDPAIRTLVGDPVERLTVLARQLGATAIHLSEHPNPGVVETAEALRAEFRVVVHPRPVFADYPTSRNGSRGTGRRLPRRSSAIGRSPPSGCTRDPTHRRVVGVGHAFRKPTMALWSACGTS